ncbi:piggyBac transposable element-derived protein 4 [Nephila pilipes]|uniref:PiggyBac transposable element-derived protein 4 n=1 Tax=Nephila pilipes TaxID=299642 RepID=A0A8X6IQ14_NEPPI|nr:piggyBac transposable element-derived protein 4 [Nephila pilipes]
MPKELSKSKLRKGEVRSLCSRDLLALRWSDKRDVSAANIVMLTSWIRGKRERGKMVNVFKQNCVIEYNNGMGGVDKNDQQLACFPVMRKYMKGYKKNYFSFNSQNKRKPTKRCPVCVKRIKLEVRLRVRVNNEGFLCLTRVF